MRYSDSDGGFCGEGCTDGDGEDDGTSIDHGRSEGDYTSPDGRRGVAAIGCGAGDGDYGPDEHVKEVTASGNVSSGVLPWWRWGANSIYAKGAWSVKSIDVFLLSRVE